MNTSDWFTPNQGAPYQFHSHANIYEKIAYETFHHKLAGIVDMTLIYLRRDGHTNDCLQMCLNVNTGSPLYYFPPAILDTSLHVNTLTYTATNPHTNSIFDNGTKSHTNSIFDNGTKSHTNSIFDSS